VGWGIEVLVEGFLTAERPAALAALVFWSVGWEIDVLVEGLLRVECPIALLTFEGVTWGIEVLLQCPQTMEGSTTRLTVLGHFAQRLLRRCTMSWNSVRQGIRLPRSVTDIEQLLDGRNLMPEALTYGISRAELNSFYYDTISLFFRLEVDIIHTLHVFQCPRNLSGTP
jgi:hypothetical protein